MERNPWTLRLVGCVTVLLLLVLHGTARAHEPPDYRSRFFEEILTPEQTAWSHRFNAYETTSYTLDKLDLVRSLPDVARARGLKLLGVLVVGPIGPLWSYHVVTFVREEERVRVVAVVFPHARLVHKSTGSLSTEEYEDLCGRLFAMIGFQNVDNADELEVALKRIAPPDDTDHSLESLADFVFTRFGASGLDFGKVERHRIPSQELDKNVSPLLRSLKETYRHGQRPRVLSRRENRSFAFGLLADVTAEPVPELDQALATFGFAGFDDTVLSFGLGGDVLWCRLRIGFDITYGARRAEHRTLDTHATWTSIRASPRIGFELAEYGGFSLSLGLGLRWDIRNLYVDARALPGGGSDDLVLERNSLGAELSVLAEYCLVRTLSMGFFVGTRIGAVRGLAETDFDLDSVVGNPETSSRGAFGALYFGVSGPS